jgi:hypothetical protein
MEQGIVLPQDSRVACGLLRCHYRRSASQAMGGFECKRLVYNSLPTKMLSSFLS